jgi:crotonobetainyl-CoA:carnitine CoA-transferase CaiB-like acyl-CoA transferase
MNPLASMWAALGGAEDALSDVDAEYRDPVMPSTYPIGALTVTAVAVATMGANEVWRARTGERQRVRVTSENALRACRSDQLVHVDGQRLADIWNRVAGFYATGDDRFVQLHTNFPHHLARTLQVLDVEEDRDAVAAAIRGWNGAELEDALAAAGACASLARTRDEWLAHPQGAAAAALPLLDARSLGTSRPLGRGARPLEGVRVVDMTRVIAGPIATRTLAAHGADVLRVSSRRLPEIDALLPDTSIGKRSAFVELPEEADALRALVRDADVLVQSYRPGALAALGFGADQLAQINPNIVYVSMSAYSHAGPWHDRRGYDTLVQTASGIALAEGAAFGLDRPKHIPISGLDHATGYFAAAAAMLALARGESCEIRCSLAQTREWVETLGRVDGVNAPRPDDDAIIAQLPTIESAFGRVTYAPPGGALSLTPPRWDHGAVAPGSSANAWVADPPSGSRR